MEQTQTKITLVLLYSSRNNLMASPARHVVVIFRPRGVLVALGTLWF